MYDNKYIHGLDLVNGNLEQYKEFVKDKLVFGGVIRMGKILDSGIIQNINNTCHSLEELRKAGHPYGYEMQMSAGGALPFGLNYVGRGYSSGFKLASGGLAPFLLRRATKKRMAGGSAFHDPEYLVHKQSGELRSSFYSNNFQRPFTGEHVHVAGVSEAVAPHAKFVIMGTSKMVPRDFLGGTLQEKAQEMRDEFINFMKKTRFRKAAKK